MGPKPKILIVDDDPVFRKTLSDILEARGYVPISFAGGKTALERVEEEGPTIALIDLKLEDMTGLELLEKIKKRSPGTECVLITGYASRESAIEAVNLGAYGYLRKPYDMEQLLLLIRRAVEKQVAETALREHQQRLQFIVDHSPDNIFLQDAELRYTWVATPAYPLTREEYIGKTDFDLAPREDAERLTAIKQQVIATGRRLTAETPLTLKGQQRIYDATYEPWRDAGGQLIGLAGYVRDITDSKRAEAALKQYADRLRTLLAIDGAILATWSPKAIIEVALRHLARLVPYQQASVVLFDWETHEGTLLALAGEGEPSLSEGSRLPLKGMEDMEDLLRGKVCVIKDSTTSPTPAIIKQVLPTEDLRSFLQFPLRSQDQLTGCLLLGAKSAEAFSPEHVDIVHEVANQIAVALRQAHLRAALEGQERRLQSLVEHLPEGVLLLDSDRRILLFNPVMESYRPALTDATVGDRLTHLAGHPIEQLLGPASLELWRELAVDGPPAWVFEMIAQPVKIGLGTHGWVLVVRDVTREREIQQRVKEQDRLAAVGQLAAGIAHDFNNIMASVVLYAGLLRRSPGLSSKDQERLNVISQQGHRAADLVRQILDFSRQSVIQRLPLDLVPFMRELEELLARTLPENIQLGLEYGHGACVVHADPGRLQQVLMNLALNARDAMHAQGGGELRVELSRYELQTGEWPAVPEMPTGAWVRMTVTDTGAGIPPEVLPHIFEPFFTTKEVGEGTGLGLAQVYGIVGQHDGYIDVESEIGRGTTFTIYLPALGLPQVEPAAAEEGVLVEGSGESVLVVEDDAAARTALTEVLESLGYRVLVAANGEEALAIIEELGDASTGSAQGIALVLSDLVMPKLGGMALHALLKDKYPGVKMVVTTGYPLANEGKSLLEQGIAAWIAKPFSADEIAQKVREVLGGA